MNTRGLINYIHRKLGKSPFAVKLAILLRNQARCVIKSYLNEDANPMENGEAWLVKLIGLSCSTFIDVGANVGDWTALILDVIPKGSKGLLFDPSDFAIDKLNYRFGQTDGIIIIQAGVSDNVGKMSFYEQPEAGETSSLVAEFSGSTAIEKLVNITTLDVEVKKHCIEYIDFLKIDTEGYDFHVIKGSSDLLSKQRIGIIQFEYNTPWAMAGSTLYSAISFLEFYGYRVFILKSTGLFELNYECYGEYFDYSNFIAVSPDKFAEMSKFIKGIL